jgi:hypothetical protein
LCAPCGFAVQLRCAASDIGVTDGLINAAPREWRCAVVVLVRHLPKGKVHHLEKHYQTISYGKWWTRIP